MFRALTSAVRRPFLPHYRFNDSSVRLNGFTKWLILKRNTSTNITPSSPPQAPKKSAESYHSSVWPKIKNPSNALLSRLVDQVDPEFDPTLEQFEFQEGEEFPFFPELEDEEIPDEFLGEETL
jgi:hypothetical protein